MNERHIAMLAVERWRAEHSTNRTEARLTALVTAYAESYFGTSSLWNADVRAHVQTATDIALSQRKPYER